jgi:hypothetical protein
MPGALLDVFDVVESLGCDHGEPSMAAKTGPRRKREIRALCNRPG